MRRLFIIMMALLLTLSIVPAALASEVEVAVVDATAPVGSVTLAPGESAAITINMKVTGKQEGTATFKVYTNWTLSGGVFAGSNPETFTVNPRAAQDPDTTFSTAGTVTVAAAQGAGTFTLAVGAFDITNSNDTGAKLKPGISSNYQVTVEVPQPPSDTTPPTGSITINGGASYTKTATVTLNLSATDNVGVTAYKVADGADSSGATPVAVTSTPSFSTDIPWTLPSGDGTKQVSVMYGDAAGNWSYNYTASILLDTTPPEITIKVPEDGGVYALNQIVNADWEATDSGSGVASATGTVPSGSAINTSKVGEKTFTVRAEDNAGNEATKTVTYAVHYVFGGIRQPINADGSSVFKLGSTIPVKFQLFDAAGNPVSGAEARIYLAKISNNVLGYEVEAVSTSAATTGNLFRYDFTDNQYIFNLATKSLSKGSWVIIIRLDDGTSQTVIIGLR